MKKTSFKIICAILAFAISAIGFTGCGISNEETTTEDASPVSSTAYISEEKNPLTGEKGYNADYLSSRPVAIMVENTPDARPQWGLCSPDIIFETEVEGGITRMMWVYANESLVPDKVGPIRSTRNAYVELAMGLDAILFHIGASDIAYEDYIYTNIIDDIDGMSINFFSRDKSRNVSTEHTAFTTGTSVKKAIKENISDTEISDYYASPFNFVSSGATASGTDCTNVKAFFSDSYIHNFTYDAQKGLYYNYMGSTPMNDADGNQMCVKNVVVLFADMVNLGDAKGHVDVDLSNGDGFYISEGKVIDIIWEKGDYDNRLKLYDINGNELSLNAGKSWFGFIRSTNSSSTVLS